MKFTDDGNETDCDAAMEALHYLLAMWRILSMVNDEKNELGNALEYYGALGALLTNTAISYVDDLETERLRLARVIEKGGK
jgi:hypothetical protein